MESVTIKDINKILEDAPKNVLQRVFGYIEALLENESEKSNPDFTLTEAQKKTLEQIANRPYCEHTDAENFVKEMRSKYGI